MIVMLIFFLLTGCKHKTSRSLTMAASISYYSVRQCSQCTAGMEFLCRECGRSFCFECKEKHMYDPKTIDHSIVLYSNRYPAKKLVDTDDTYDSLSFYFRDRLKHEKFINNIRRTVLINRIVLLTEYKNEIKACHSELLFYQSEVFKKAKILKECINSTFTEFHFPHKCLRQKIEMDTYIDSMEQIEKEYEHASITPVQFLVFTKKRVSNIHDVPSITKHCQVFLPKTLVKKGVTKSLNAFQIKNNGKRLLNNKHFLKLMYEPVLQQHRKVTYIRNCRHISFATTEKVWISDDEKKIILTNKTGQFLHLLYDICSDSFSCGLHTVNSENELTYIDKDHKIKILSTDFTSFKLIKAEDSIWKPLSVYFSWSTGDLLVGACRFDTWIGKIIRYSQTGEQKQQIQQKNLGRDLFREPYYLTENNNGDIVVSNWPNAVVVVNRRGKHRFSYTGHLSGSQLRPRGVCTDAMSHILVCDERTNTVHIVSNDGQFLSKILIRPPGIFTPFSLKYDINTQRLWVGSKHNNNVFVYRYVLLQDGEYEELSFLIDKYKHGQVSVPISKSNYLLIYVMAIQVRFSYLRVHAENI